MKNFRYIKTPNSLRKLVPDDISFRYPIQEVNPARATKAVEIPWEEAYAQSIPEELYGYWDVAFRYLHQDSADVHVAICLKLMVEFLGTFDPGFYDPIIVGAGLIFHNMQISEKLFNEELARFDKLSGQQLETIREIVVFSDQPEKAKDKTLNFKISHDLNSFWVFTHENFWQTTVASEVTPQAYWKELEAKLGEIMLTEQGKKLARRLLGERRDELNVYEKTMQGRI